MANTLASEPAPRIAVPVIALSLYAISSGYLMSLIPLMLSQYGISSSMASWLASVFYAGLLIGAIFAERLVHHLGHRNTFVLCLGTFIATVIALPVFANDTTWLVARFIAGMAVAGVFVTVESWLMAGDESSRAKRLSFYMISLYGGSALGQFGIGLFGVEGALPFVLIVSSLTLAVFVLVFVKSETPNGHESESLSLKQSLKLNHAAIIGCIVSGLTLGAIYGLMPVELAKRGISNQEIGTLMALVILGGMAIQPVVTAMTKHMGRALLMAFYCLMGVFAIGLTLLSSSMYVLAAALFILGMATFALYPIAISLGCEKIDEKYIVSVAQVMLFSYSVGSVVGPVIADSFMAQTHSLFDYLFVALLATGIYMLIASMKTGNHMVASS